MGGVPQRHPNSRQQFVYPEGLGQVVVSAKVQSDNLVAFGFTRGEHDDWRACSLADGSDDIQAVHIRQAKIEEHQVGMKARIRVQRVLAGAGGLDSKVVATQVRLDGAYDAGLVIDYQHPRPAGVRHATTRVGASVGTAGGAPVTGSVKVKRAPPPARFSAHTRPP